MATTGPGASPRPETAVVAPEPGGLIQGGRPAGDGGEGGPPEPAELLGAITDYVIVALGPDGSIRTWNPGAANLTGYEADEVVGRHVAMLYDGTDEARREVDAVLAEARIAGRAATEGWRTRKDGSMFWGAGVVTQLDREGYPGFCAVWRDTTDHRRAEQLLEQFLEGAPDATVIVDVSGRIVRVNQETELLFGWRREDLVGQAVEVLVPTRFRNQHLGYRSDFMAEMSRRPMGRGLQLYGVRSDGTEFPVEVSLSPVQAVGQEPLVIAAVRDVTERHRAMEQLKLQRDEILELSTPVIEVWDNVLVLPIIGTLDTARADQLTEGLLAKIAEHGAEVVVLDISGVPTIDSVVAHHLLRTVQAAGLMGATSIMSGVRPETAQAMVHLGIDLGSLRSRSTLRDALQLAISLLGYRS